jgi:hypothetical protein
LFAHTEGEALIIENNTSRKIKEFKSKAETALWFVESYGLVPQYLKLPDMFVVAHHKILSVPFRRSL